jgi:hypothetical protein
MGEMLFAAALGAGAALISLWVDFRLSGHRPKSARAGLVHVLVALVVLQVAVGVAGRLGGENAAVEQRLSAVFFLLLPGLVYAFMSALWLLRSLAEAAAARR